MSVMGLVIGILWLILAEAYFRFRKKKGDFSGSDYFSLSGTVVFAISCPFQGEAFWEPRWNLYIKIFAFILMLIGICTDRITRRRPGSDS